MRHNWIVKLHFEIRAWTFFRCLIVLQCHIGIPLEIYRIFHHNLKEKMHYSKKDSTILLDILISLKCVFFLVVKIKVIATSTVLKLFYGVGCTFFHYCLLLFITLIDSCDISTGVIRLRADNRCKRSRACCSTAITNASWTALPSSPAGKEKRKKKLVSFSRERKNRTW